MGVYLDNTINLNPIVRYFKFTHKGKPYRVRRDITSGIYYGTIYHEIKFTHPDGIIISYTSPHGADDVIQMFKQRH